MKRAAFAALAAIGFLSFAASAGTPSQVMFKELCENQTVAFELEVDSVKACTMLIQSGILSRNDLSLAYFWRAKARDRVPADAGMAEKIALSIQDYGKAIELDDGNGLAYGGRGDDEFDLAVQSASIRKTNSAAKLYRAAVRDSDHAIKRKPDSYDFYNTRAVAEGALGEKHKAQADKEMACSLYVGACSSAVALACVNSSVSAQEAIAACTALIQSGKLSAQSLELVYLIRNMAYIESNQFALALQDSGLVIGINPSVDSYMERASDEDSPMGQYQDALQDYSKVIELCPYFASAYADRANMESNLAESQAALQDRKAMYLAAIQDYSKAIEVAETEEAYQLMPAGFDASYLKSRTNVEQMLALTDKEGAYDGGDDDEDGP